MSFLSAAHTGEDVIKLEPPRASLGQLQLTNRLEMIRVEQDVLGVVEHLKGIDPGLVLLFDKKQEIYVLYWEGFRAKEEGGTPEWCEDLVGSYLELDQRLINLIERIDGQGRGRYDLERELDRLDREAERERERVFSERIGDQAERLRYALRQDLGSTGSQVYLSERKGRQRAKGRRR